MALKAAVSAALMGCLLALVDYPYLAGLVRQARGGFLLMVVAVTIADRLFMAFKWRILLRALGLRIPLSEAVKSYFISSFLGIFMPVSIGADAARILTVNLPDNTRDRITASIVMERLLGMLALAFLVLVCSIFLQIAGIKIPSVLLPFSLAVFLSVALVFLLSLLVPERFLRMRSSRILKFLADAASSYQTYSNRKGHLLLFFILSFCEHLLPVFSNYFVAAALRIEISPLVFFVIIPIILAFSRMPVSLDGIGVQEALYPALFSMAGMSQQDAISIALTARVLTTLALLPGGLMLALARKTAKLDRKKECP